MAFENPCFDTQILQAPLATDTFSASLFEPVFIPLPLASSTNDCGQIQYYLRGLEDPDVFQIDTFEGQFGFWVTLTDAD